MAPPPDRRRPALEPDRPCTIVGGGLVGALLATILAERGHAVTVYERRADIRVGQAEAGRSINLVVTPRGFRGLAQVGLEDAARALTVPVLGRMIHDLDGALTFQPYGRDEHECNHSVSRAALNAFLLGEAAARGVELCFETRVVDLDLARRQLVVEDVRSGARSMRPAGVVLGTDGAASAVRQALVARAGLTESIAMLAHGYKELEIPAGPGGAFRIDPRALHIWPRGALMMMALPNADGSFTVTLYLPHEGAESFAAVRDAPAVGALFARHFPDAIALLPDLARQWLEHPLGTLGTVRAWPWRHEDWVLLLGDAAHAIVPFFGQGMNAGFEDCTVLMALAEDATSWGELFARFERQRKPAADAIADMALENFVEMRDRVADPAFLLRKQVAHRLEVEMPRAFRSRYSMVMYSHIPYDVCRNAGRIEERLLDELCRELRSPDELDLAEARALVARHLAPFLDAHGIDLDY